MKLITFNINSSNKYIEEDLNTLYSLNADIYCIQEFPEEKLDELILIFKSYSITTCREYFLTKQNSKKKSLKQLNIILSKYSFETIKKIPHIPMTRIPLLYKITLRANSSLIESHYVDIIINDKKIRLVNLHLECFIFPKFRIEQFKHLYTKATSNKEYDYIFFVGDFNIFAKPMYNWILAPFFQYSLKEVCINEYLAFEKETSQRELQMHFPNSSTLKKIPIKCDGVISNMKYLKHQKNRIEVKRNLIKTSSDHYIIEVFLEI